MITATLSYDDGDPVWTLAGDDLEVEDLVDHLPLGWVADGLVVSPVLAVGVVTRQEQALDRAAFRRGLRIKFVQSDDTEEKLEFSLAVTRALKGQVA